MQGLPAREGGIKREREKAEASRKRRRERELDLLYAKGVAFSDIGVAIETEQLHDEDSNELYGHAIAAMPDN
jgi:hypothetical protein